MNLVNPVNLVNLVNPAPEENDWYSIIAQVIIRATAFSCILFVSSLETSRNRVL